MGLVFVGYLLSKKEQKSGTPERPLSALGAIGYKKYWTLALMRYLQNAPCNPRLEGAYSYDQSIVDRVLIIF